MKLALVGRDGVINEAREGGINHRTQLTLIPDSINGLARLSKAGYKVIIVTHQPGISRGLFDLDELEAIHYAITSGVEEAGGEITAIFYCPHDDQDRCHCRPPETGLLDAIEMEFDCDTVAASFFFYSDAEKKLAKAKDCLQFQCTPEKNLSFFVNQLLS